MLNISAQDQLTQDGYFMNLAYQQAQQAALEGEVPVGALVVKNNSVISSAYNKKEAGLSSTYHAELLAIEKASLILKNWRLSGCTLYVTLEPCIMCSGALIASRIERLVYATPDPKGGGIESVYQIATNPSLNHQVKVSTGILQQPCSQILKDFFKTKR